MPNRDGSSSDSYDFGKLGYGKPNWSTSANIDYTIGSNFMVNFRVGYFFLGTDQPARPRPGQHHLRTSVRIYRIGNTAITDVPASAAPPQQLDSRSDQSMTYPFETAEESNLCPA